MIESSKWLKLSDAIFVKGHPTILLME